MLAAIGVIIGWYDFTYHENAIIRHGNVDMGEEHLAVSETSDESTNPELENNLPEAVQELTIKPGSTIEDILREQELDPTRYPVGDWGLPFQFEEPDHMELLLNK